jgi:hypothetical protein
VQLERGDLVKSPRFKSIGVVVEIFEDLDKDNPWIRVLFTHPKKIYQWCRISDLEKVVQQKKD